MLNKAPDIVMSWHRGNNNGTGDVMLGCQALDTQQVETLGVPEDYSYMVLEGHYYLVTN